MLKNNEYSLAFTTMAAQIPETVSVVNIFVKQKDWKKVGDFILNENTMNKSKEKTSKKIFLEIRKRVSNLSVSEIEFLASSSLEDQKILILISILKTYRIIYDFIFEIVMPKWELYDFYINDSDYSSFIDSKMNLYPELQDVSILTKKKVKQRIFTILHQVGMIDNVKDRKILKPLISFKLSLLLKEEDPFFLKLCNY